MNLAFLLSDGQIHSLGKYATPNVMGEYIVSTQDYFVLSSYFIYAILALN